MKIVKTKKLNKNFEQADNLITAVKDVSLELDQGQTLAVVGPSGSGKTTLLSLLAGLEKPSSGEIVINGQDIKPMDEKSLAQFRAQNIGIIFQQFHLMPHLSAQENVSLPLEILKKSAAKQKAQEALSRVGLGERLSHRPHQLSGGECQRVAIARALVVEPRLLLSDEPSGNLDLKTGETVMDLLFDLVTEKSTTMILVTHDIELAKRCDRQLTLVGGLIQ